MRRPSRCPSESTQPGLRRLGVETAWAPPVPSRQLGPAGRTSDGRDAQIDVGIGCVIKRPWRLEASFRLLLRCA